MFVLKIFGLRLLLMMSDRFGQLQRGGWRLKLADAGGPQLLLLLGTEADINFLPVLDDEGKPVKVFPFSRNALNGALACCCLRNSR
jgi:hypothetical protein